MNFLSDFATNGSSIIVLVFVLFAAVIAAVHLDRNDRQTAKAAAHRLQVEGQLASLKESWTLQASNPTVGSR